MSGRIRTIKPEWLEDELLASQTDSVRLLSVAIILLADDHGRGRAAPPFIVSQAWMYDVSPESLTKAREGLTKLASIGFIRLYAVENQAYYEIRNWSKHQKVQHPSAPRVPPPSAIREGLTKPTESLTPDLRSPITDHRSLYDDDEKLTKPREGSLPEPKNPVADAPVPKPSKSKSKSACPSSDASAEQLSSWLSTWKIPPESDPQVSRFLNHHRSKGNRFVDWGAAWRNWSTGRFVSSPTTGGAQESEGYIPKNPPPPDGWRPDWMPKIPDHLKRPGE